MGRSLQDLDSFPCAYKLKDYVKPGSPSAGVEKVKILVPKLDANGKPIYKDAVGNPACNCKNKGSTIPSIQNNGVAFVENSGTPTQVPEMVEVWVDRPISAEDSKMVLCKLFGAVRRTHCLGCKTYKTK